MALIEQTMTLEEFLRLPEVKPAREYHDGRVTQKVSPQPIHGRLQGKLATKINDYAESRRLGLALPETRCTFARRSIVPDVTTVAWKRIPRDSSGKIAKVFRLAPDISVEILSPEQDARELEEKLTFCVDNGVQAGLLIDPEKEQVSVFRPDRQPETIRSGRIDLSPVLAGLACSVEEIFGWLVLPE